MKVILLLLIITNGIFLVDACESNLDCTQCHYCDKISRRCIQIAYNTDPFDECGTKCNTKMVCGVQGYCVYLTQPQCNCDWKTHNCKEDSLHSSLLLSQEISTPVPIHVSYPNPTSDMKLNPDDILLIKEVLAQHKFQNQTPFHENTPSLEEHHYYIIVLLILTKIFAIVFLFVKRCRHLRNIQGGDIESQKSIKET